MNACAKAEHPPYALGKEYADKVLDLMKQMRQHGLKPNDVHYNIAMDCQV